MPNFFMRGNAEGLILFLKSIDMNGTVGNGVWFGRGALLPNSPSYIFDRGSKIIGLSWTNENTARNFDLEFYKNGRATTKFYTYQARNIQIGYANALDFDFVAGDYIDIKMISQGALPSDMGLDIIIKTTEII